MKLFDRNPPRAARASAVVLLATSILGCAAEPDKDDGSSDVSDLVSARCELSGDSKVKATKSALCKAVSGRSFEVVEGGKRNDRLQLVEMLPSSPEKPGPAAQPPLRPVTLVATIARAVP